MDSMDLNTSAPLSIPNKSSGITTPLQKDPPSPMEASIKYKECKKNHAATIGGHAVDGCCEFMASEVAPLTCAACGCHRNFHRKEISPAAAADVSPDPLRVMPISSFPPSRDIVRNGGKGNGKPNRQRVMKRCRTKFNAEQKEKMRGLAEELGWKLQKGNDEKVEEFCERVGVDREVFKVWMHNHKCVGKKGVGEVDARDGGNGSNGGEMNGSSSPNNVEE